MVKLDRTDLKIINSLINDSKKQLRVLAGEIGISFVTVMNRIKKLEKEKIITKYSARINFEKIGYDTSILILIKISKGKLFELEKKIASLPNVYAVYDITGEYDALVISKFKNTREMDLFIKKLQTFEFIEKTNTSLILNTIKEDQIRI